jgi:hypothetical protein
VDSVAETFEEFVSRGAIIDMMAEYIAGLDNDDVVFGEETDEEDESEDEGEEEEKE